MADGLAKFLEWGVKLSNYYTVLIVLICFVLMVIFILRLNSENMVFSPSPAIPFIPEHDMVPINIPFALELVKEGNSSLTGGVEVSISCLRQCHLVCMWGVSIDEIHRELQNPWDMMIKPLLDGTFLTEHCLHIQNTEQIFICSKRNKPISCPDGMSEADLGPSPRQKYPLVTILFTEEDHTSVVATITIFHIKDTLCSLNSYIVAQYLKTSTGHLYNLKPLYAASSPKDLNVAQETVISQQEEAPNSVTNTSAEMDMNDDCLHCVVCQMAPITQVLLPCRHFCVCSSCFHHIDSCPMCRGPIDSYFSTNNGIEQNVFQRRTSERMPQRPSGFWDKLEALNNRLNEWFGFV